MKRWWLVLGALLLLWLGSGVAPGPVEAQEVPGGGGRVDVLISFDDDPDATALADVRAFGARIGEQFQIAPVLTASVPAWTLPFLERLPGVAAVEPDARVHVTTIATELTNTWGVEETGAGTIHAGGELGAGITVAVIDTGVDYTHPELAAAYAGGYDFANNDGDPRDDHGHGTHVSGTLVAARNGTGVVGMAPSADLLAVKVLDAGGGGTYSDVIAGIQWAVNNGADVINMSLGGGSFSSALQTAVNNAADSGVVLVASAGNNGNSWGFGDNVLYPAKYDAVIAVAAVDRNRDRASFSSTGSQVELAAPGVRVRSTIQGGGFADWNGTSMAAPHVSGAAVLVLGAGIADGNGNGLLNDDVRTRLQTTADDISPSGRDTRTGFGFVDAAEAAGGGGGAPPPNSAPSVSITSPSDGDAFEEGATVTFTGSASDNEDGALSGSIRWSSSLDGNLGTGSSVASSTLDAGTHTITASVTDSGGLSDSATIQITVNTSGGSSPPPSGDTVTVQSVSYSDSFWVLTVSIKLIDSTGSGVGNAGVNITISNGASSWERSGTTGGAGTLSWSLFFPPGGCYETTVNSVSVAGKTWDGQTPPNSHCR